MSPNTQTTITQRVPFSWENQPGTPFQKENEKEKTLIPIPTENTLKLPPPPSLKSNPKPPFHNLYVPLPPCPFQPPEKISPSLDDQDDPFLMAYLECTKSVKHVRTGSHEEKKKDLWGKMKRVGVQIGIRLACNSNRHVRDDDHYMRPLPQISEID